LKKGLIVKTGTSKINSVLNRINVIINFENKLISNIMKKTEDLDAAWSGIKNNSTKIQRIIFLIVLIVGIGVVFKNYFENNIDALKYEMGIGKNERYKKLGFASPEEMEAYSKRGFSSMSAYQEAKALNPQYFNDNCDSASKKIFEANCKGKKISWFGIVSRASKGDAVHIEVTNEDGSALKSSLSIDSKSLSKYISEKEVGKLIEFDGIIFAQNIIYPDIENISFVKIETADESVKRLKKVEEAKKIELKRIEEAKKLELSENLMNFEYIKKHYLTMAQIRCERDVENNALNNFEWFNSRHDRFIAVGVYSPGVLSLMGDTIKFQNGLGAWKIMEYRCEYDVKTEKVIRVIVGPRS
jgi:hypothetical protein